MADINRDALHRVSPLTHLQERFRAHSAATEGLIALRELPRKTQISLRGKPNDPIFRKAIQNALWIDIPTTPNTTIRDSTQTTILWLGPDEWLIVGDDALADNVISRLKTELGSLHSSVLDVSDARTVLELSGTRSRELLAKGCGLDLHPRSFYPATCVQTNLARANIILHLLDEKPTWNVYVRISFANYLASWLVDALTEYCVKTNN